jgi:hypothetical protein
MKYLFPLLAVLFVAACQPTSAKAPQGPAKLLFSSGFEGVTLRPLKDGYQTIAGPDSVTGYHWPITVLGASDSGLHMINHDNQQALHNEIQTVTGHNGRPTRALFSVENYEHRDDTQDPYEILGITDGRRDLYIRYWIKLDRSSLTQPDKWRTFFEWKTKDYAKGSGFRLISFIYTDDDGKPYWVWQGDRDPQHPIWEIENRKIPVPMGKWFLTEFYWHWSEGKDGRALWKVNGQIVGDHSGPTTRNHKPIDFIMLTQIYGNANPKHQWVDDIEIWDGLPD